MSDIITGMNALRPKNNSSQSSGESAMIILNNAECYKVVNAGVYAIPQESELLELAYRDYVHRPLEVDYLLDVISKNECDSQTIRYAKTILSDALVRYIQENLQRIDKDSTEETSKGLRYNNGKLRWSLLPVEPIVELIRVLEKGAVKYAPNNWKKFTKAEADENCYDSMMRHIQQWRLGQTHDEETGLHHMAHIMCNAMFILWHSINEKR